MNARCACGTGTTGLPRIGDFGRICPTDVVFLRRSGRVPLVGLRRKNDPFRKSDRVKIIPVDPLLEGS